MQAVRLIHSHVCTQCPQYQAATVLQAVPGLAALNVRSHHDIEWLPPLPGLTSLSLEFQFDPDAFSGEWGWRARGWLTTHWRVNMPFQVVQGGDVADGRSIDHGCSIICTNLGCCHASR